MRPKILSLLLALCLVVGMVPVAVVLRGWLLHKKKPSFWQ